MIKYIKSNFKSILCVILAFCMIFSFIAPLSKILVSAGDSPAKMLYFKTTQTSASNRRLYQRAAVVEGETYYFSFWLSKDISFTPICRTDGSRSSINANIELIERLEKGESAFYTYSYTMPKNSNVTPVVFFGIQFTSTCEGYFFDASVYNVKDQEKTELLENPDFANDSLDRWAWDWDVWFAPSSTSTSNVGVKEWTNDSGTITLKVMDFDKTLIAEEEETPDKMLHIDYKGHTVKDKHANELYQAASVTKGETYYFTFSLSDSIDNFEIVCRANGLRPVIKATINQESKQTKEGYTVYTYSCKMPDDSTVTSMAFFGIRLKEVCEGYFFNASLKLKNDENELLTNSDFSEGVLNEWAWGWLAWFKAGQTGAGLTSWNNDIVSLEVVDYDDSLFDDNDGDLSSSSSSSSSSGSSDSSTPDGTGSHKMLHIDYKGHTVKDKHANELYQAVPVAKGETYYFTFGLSDSIDNFEIVCRANGLRPVIKATINQESKQTKEGYTVYTYSCKMPDDSTVTSVAFFGIRLKEVCEGYFFDASIYHMDDSNKTELLTNSDFSEGVLNEWAWGWLAWFKAGQTGAGLTSWNNDIVSLEVVDYDDSLFDDNDGDLSSSSSSSSSSGSSDSSTPDGAGSHKMLHIDYKSYVSSQHQNELYQLVPVTKGETYYFTFGLSNSIDNFDVVCRANDLRPVIRATIKQESKEIKDRYTVYTYSCKMPDDSTVTSMVFFGISLKEVCEGYFFDASIYHEDDSNQTELLTNPDFSSGVLDNWAWGWKIWFRGISSGLTNWKYDIVSLEVVDYDESLFKEGEPPVIPEPEEPVGDKMLHINTTAGKELYQRAYVTVGETYYFTFSVSDSIQKFIPVCYADSQRPAVEADIQLVNTVDEYGYKIYTYSYTIPETDSKGKPMTELAFFGIKLTGTVEGYFFGASVYKANDKNKTELLDNPDFKIGLDEWAWGWDAWFRGTSLGLTKWNNDKTTLEIVDLDRSLFEEIQAPVYSKKMLHINTTGGKDLAQRIPVEIGKTYHFKFSLSNSINFFTAVCLADDNRPNVDANIELIEKVDRKGYTIYTYSYTIPEKADNGKAMTEMAFFGIKLSGTQQGYFFDASVYKADDNKKTELLGNPDFKIGLDEWAWGWDVWFRGDKEGLEKWENDKTKLTLVGYDESLFDNEEDITPKMLYIKTASPKELMQRAKVKAGETYYFTFSLTDTIKSFEMLCRSDSQRNAVKANIKFIDKIDKDGYNTYTYSYTLPKTYINSSEEEVALTDNIFFGIRPSVSCEGYMFDVSLYKANEKYKTELFENSNFQVGLDRWTWGWDVWFAHSEAGPAGLYEWNNANTTLKVVDISKALMDEVNSKIPGKQMVYFINGAISSHLGARVNLELGAEYYMQFSAFSTDEVSMKVSKDGNREALRNIEKELISAEEHGNYTTYLYKFIMPEDQENNLVFAGPVLKYYSEGFVFDLMLYKADDENKTNLWANADFAAGLDGWIWNWHAWFGYDTASGTKDWTNGANTVKLMDFDLSKIDELIALLNINDGEWWNPKDLINENQIGKASLIGTFVDQNKKPFVGAKLVLESTDNSYKATTNSQGKFEFKDFIEGFYELYVLDPDGNKVSTGFYTNFSNGDVITLNLVSDSSSISEDSSVNVNDFDTESDAESEKTSVGSILGTVYTPKLKTVADLKIYIRGVGQTVTDKKGYFEFTDIPVGDYEIYTVLADGSEYIFRTVSVKENVELTIKLKYAPDAEASVETESGFNWLWVITPTAAAVLIAIGVAVVIILRKRKIAKANK